MKTIARWSDLGPYGIDPLKRCHKPTRRFAYSGPFKDRNQHQIGRRGP
jgi:hypothetical protein